MNTFMKHFTISQDLNNNNSRFYRVPHYDEEMTGKRKQASEF